MIYLDHNAATTPLPHVYESILERQDVISFNPDSQHAAGRIAKGYVEDSRRLVAALVGVKSKDVIFTSGATESNAIALSSYKKNGYLILTQATEHSSVISHSDITIEVNADGTTNLDDLQRRLERPGIQSRRTVLACMYANNETGVISDPKGLVADMCSKYGTKLHIDASQCYGKGRTLPKKQTECASTVVLSGHKMRSLKGVGVLIIKDDIFRIMEPLARGGHHELGIRPGTLNTEAIYSMGLAAAEWARVSADSDAEMANKISYIENSLKDISEVNGSADRLSNTINLHFPKVTDTQAFVESLSQNGVYVSGMSACNSGFDARSRVLEAMYGKDSVRADGSIRISICRDTSWKDIKSASEIIRNVALAA